MGDAAKAVPATAALLMKVLLEIFFMTDPFFHPLRGGVREGINCMGEK
jgi:hypothetical protein